MFKLVLSCALFAVACGANTDGLSEQELTDALAKLKQDELQRRSSTSISTDNDGNINMNTKVNGDLVLNRREESSIRISDMLKDITAAQDDISSMKDNTALYVSAQTFMNNLAGDIIEATRSIAVVQASQSGVLDSMKSNVESQISKISGTVDKQLLDAKATADAATRKAADDAAAAIVTQANALKETQANLAKALKDAKAEIAKSTKTQIDAVSKSLLFSPKKTYVLIDWMAGSENTRAKGRVFYKVNFNPSNVGYFHCDRRQLKQACTDLSKDLKAMDNIDRGLKPACNNPSHCDGNGVQLPGSYLSHYGCGGYEVSDEGYGMPMKFTAGVLMYNRENSWNGCEMLMKTSNCNDHVWINRYHYSTYKASSTLCTSSNSNFKKGPQ